jgi:hypothetical protein
LAASPVILIRLPTAKPSMTQLPPSVRLMVEKPEPSVAKTTEPANCPPVTRSKSLGSTGASGLPGVCVRITVCWPGGGWETMLPLAFQMRVSPMGLSMAAAPG